jgi:glycosyltransferase involved in cell wall biosynthesis
MGFEVTVLTGMPNYPTGRIFDKYRWKLRMTENISGIKVIRTCLYPSKSSRLLPRLFSYLSFSVSALLLGVWGLGRHDVVLLDTPPPFHVPLSLIISKIARATPVMMVADIWPDIIIRMGHLSPGSLSVKAMLWLEKFCYNHVYAIAVTNPAARQQICERFPHLKNVTVISNGVDTQMFRPELRSEMCRQKLGASPDDFLAGFCGLHGLAQGLEVVLDAAKRLSDRPHIKFVMIGDGPTKAELLTKTSEMGLSNLRFLDRCPKSEMPEIVASLDVSLVTLSGRFPGTMPSKVYEALASSTPPIVAKGCEAEPLVTRYDAGRCYEPGDAAELADQIAALADDRSLLHRIKDNCIDLSKKFDRNLIAKHTEEVLLAVTKEQPMPDDNW